MYGDGHAYDLLQQQHVSSIRLRLQRFCRTMHDDIWSESLEYTGSQLNLVAE